jgi:hypothetical protein
MQAVVKGVSSDLVDPRCFLPDGPDLFSLSLVIRLGTHDSPVEDNFDLQVCTPRWLEKTVRWPRSGRHMLIVRQYDFSSIEHWINDCVSKCEGETWSEVANKLERYFGWEFEDYRPLT